MRSVARQIRRRVSNREVACPTLEARKGVDEPAKPAQIRVPIEIFANGGLELRAEWKEKHPPAAASDLQSARQRTTLPAAMFHALRLPRRTTRSVAGVAPGTLYAEVPHTVPVICSESLCRRLRRLDLVPACLLAAI